MLSWWLFPHSNAFSQKLSGLCLGKMHFFTSRNAFQMLFHGDCFHIQMHFLKNCRAYASAKCIFSLPEMHSKCSFMVAVSTLKCIFSKCIPNVYASAKCIFSLPEMHSKCSFMVAVSTFKCIFSSASAKCIFSLPEMHSKCFFMVAVSTFKCIFLKYCRVYASAKCIFSLPEMHSKCSFMVAVRHSNAFFQILFGVCFNSNVFFSLPQIHFKCSFMATTSTFIRDIVSQCSFAHIRTRASARTRAYRTTTPDLFLRTFENF